MPASILVIDDEYGIRSGVRQILELEGYRVAEAETGREAIERLEEGPFDVVLIDYRLPDIDGLTLLQGIRDRAPAAMTCMITAYANLETAIAATRQGIDFFLPKPFEPDDLIGVVETLLRHKRLKEEAAELRRAHEASLLALASERSQTHSLVTSLRDAVLVVNRDGEVVLANRAMAALLGAEEEALLRRPVGEVLAGRELAPVRDAYAVAEAERAGFELELGERRCVASWTPFRDEAGRVLGRILTLADVTELRRAALEKSRFIRTLVHELRAPVGAVKGLLEVAQDRSLGGELEPYLPLLQRAELRLDGLIELIGDMLSLSRIDAEVRAPAPAEPLELAPVVQEVAGLLRERAAGRNVALQVELSAGLPRLRISADDLRMLITNLLGNAIKYSKPAGGTVRLSVVPIPGWIRLAVADEGVGIQAGNLSRLFDEFFREKRTETREIEGNGLGLSIVKRLVDRAAGRIEVESTEGVGSTFTVYLPA